MADKTISRIEPLDSGFLRQIGISAATLPRTRPVYRHIMRAIERAMGAGRLTPGLRLPAERQLAAALDVSRATIVKAYRELEARGLARGHVGRGTFVSAAPDSSGAPFAWRGKVASAALRSNDSVLHDLIKDSTDPGLLSIAAGVPALDRFPVNAFKRSLEHVIRRDGAAVWGHGPTEGHPNLRQALARRFGGQPENVLALAGAQQGLDLLARCLIDPGDTVVIDRPGYLGAIHTFRAAGARLVGWDIVRHDLDELEDLIERYRPKLIYTNPTFQNPTGWTMPIRVRRGMLALAGRLRVPIIEDDTYRELNLAALPPPSLHSLDTQSVVIYLGSFAKMLAPGLRLGWIAAAEPIVEQLALIKQSADPHPQTLAQLVVAELIDQGGFDEHLKLLRQEHRRRRDALAAAFDTHHAAGQLQWALPDGGLYFWCRLPARVNASAVLMQSLTESVAFVAGQRFYVDHAGERELRLCFSGVRPDRADEVVRRLLRSIATVRRDSTAQPPLMAVVK
jgi:DNA-binding transcriptional MocR family regulator